MRHHPKEKVESLLSSAGFPEATPLQEEYVPAALQGKDLIVESVSGEGKTVAQLIPFFLQSKPRKKGPTSLILVDTVEATQKYEREFSRFSAAKSKAKQTAVLGKESQAKHELRTLSKRPGLIVGTTERIIDHIRRNNLRLENLTSVVINVPENGEHVEFARDVEFIMTKIAGRVQTVVFTPSLEKAEELAYLLKRPSTLSMAGRRSKLPSLHIFKSESRTPQLITRLVYGMELRRVLILTATHAENQQLQNELSRIGITCCLQTAEQKTGYRAGPRCKIAAFEDASGIPLSSFEAILFYGLPPKQHLFEEIGWAAAGHSPSPIFFVLVSEEEGSTLETLQEINQMKTKNEKLPEEEEVLKGKLKSIITQIKEEEDPDILNKYKKLIKKSVPLHLRGYIGAYFFKKALEGQLGTHVQSSSHVQPSSQMQTIFVSIGKNRKVFPRDLVRLFHKSLDIEQNEIGNIKVLDNYSFIDIPQRVAPKAIEEMDGMEFRGRNITVNFARKKEKKSNSRG
ncbi:MAG: DEAD/DEAH box helicase [Spirochaetota bacterium]